VPDDEDRFRPLTLRRRILVALLAVATALTLILMMIERVGAPALPRAPSAGGPARCADGQSDGCVGGRSEVIFVPANGAGSAPAGMAGSTASAPAQRNGRRE
jgi:hypothetical protein